ncbi:MAG: transcription-repair coupling factor [Erysipelotrichaceae bacterium]|nr:transcription-repair coupling factor [Erysipelotrichaceae bacterium]
MRSIVARVSQNPAVEALVNKQAGLGNLSIQEEALLVSAAFLRSHQSYVVVKSNLYEAQDLYQRLDTLLGEDNVLLYSVEESLQVEAIASSPELYAQKMDALAAMVQKTEPFICVTHTAAILRYLPTVERFKENIIQISVGQQVSMDDLKKTLIESGYKHANRVDQPLCFSFRGGVVDIFSVQSDNPVRIEFFDNEVESIRYFDVLTQRTTAHVEKVTIVPATDLLFNDEDLDQLEEKVLQKLASDSKHSIELEDHIHQDLEYLRMHVQERYLYRYLCFLPQTNSILDYIPQGYVILSSIEDVKEHAHQLMEETIGYIQELYQESKSLLQFGVYADINEVLLHHDGYEIHQFESLQKTIRSNIHPLYLPELPLVKTVHELDAMANDHVVCICVESQYWKRLIPVFIEQEIPYSIANETCPTEFGIYLKQSKLEQGLICEEEQLILVSAHELFQTKIKMGRFASKFKESQVLEDYHDLEIGDYVVHSQHGIGHYMGIVTKEFDGIHTDFLNIAYKGDDVLLVPLDQFRLVRKFVGAEGVAPKLNKLGTNEWKKTKEKLQENVEDIAEKLLELYTAREQNIGFAFSKDTELQEEFEQQFPYELTMDQAQAIQEIKEDMEKEKPMDRLLCGDVGFGKTEVAIRAAFKAIVDHKQVAYLCPTTILSRQHYITFLKRFEGYPVNIALMNRFVEPKRQKQILQGVKEGKIDILIGTHRLLSKDVEYKDLGLLIIDEEQRFGVEAKEKIKLLKKSIDVLSLSATPIPRTLQLSLIGVRSLSQLQTAPNNRMPVQTYVIEKNPKIVKEVIQRELARGGQVFYLYNNVNEIYQVARRIQKMVPRATIGVAHGKMSREEIEDVMFRFTENEYQILVCTTIIETGIDIPNANTILIDRADTFGLSQLYQIKGRVGRSDRVAYAYLMYNGKKQLSEVATKRLQSIKDFTALGSGYKIAMRDLTIRGAGDLLGAKQAGFINTVGMDMYIEMLHDAILEKRGLTPIAKEEVIKKAQIGVDGYIPQQYAPEDYEKIHLYQRIDEAISEHVLNQLEEEIKDRYGKSPKAVQLLFEKRRLELLSNNEKVDQIKEAKKEVMIYFTKEWCNHVDGVRLFECISNVSLDIKMKYEKGQVILVFTKKMDWLRTANELLEKIKKL